MQSAALLYRITGEKKYLQEAQRLAAACYNRFFSHDSQSDRKYKVLNRGDVWFTAIMFRGFVELYGIDHNSLYIDAFRENLDFAWTEMREKNGLFNERKNEKRFEVAVDTVRYGRNVCTVSRNR